MDSSAFPEFVMEFPSQKSLEVLSFCVQFKHEAHLFVDDCGGGLLVVCQRPIAGCRVDLCSRKAKVCDCERQRSWTNSAQWLSKGAGESNPQSQSKMLLFTILN